MGWKKLTFWKVIIYVKFYPEHRSNPCQAVFSVVKCQKGNYNLLLPGNYSFSQVSLQFSVKGSQVPQSEAQSSSLPCAAKVTPLYKYCSLLLAECGVQWLASRFFASLTFLSSGNYVKPKETLPGIPSLKQSTYKSTRSSSEYSVSLEDFTSWHAKEALLLSLLFQYIELLSYIPSPLQFLSLSKWIAQRFFLVLVLSQVL